MFCIGAILRAFFTLCFVATIVFAKDMLVVTSVNSNVQSLSAKQVKEIFLKKRTFVGENEVVAINLSANEQSRVVFEEKVLGMDRTELAGYWSAQHYQGITPPLTQKSQASLKALLKNLKGAVGYIDKSQMESGLKVLYEF